MREDALLARVGHRFPGGRSRVEPYVDWLVRDLVGAAADAGGALHPATALLAAQAGVGIGLEELFALFGSSSADGPVLGEWAVEFARPLRPGAEYAVTATVRDARRRAARSGVLDLVTVQIELAGPDGPAHAAVRPTYVFPRRTAAPGAPPRAPAGAPARPLPPLSRTVDVAAMKTMAALLHDPNMIHLDPAVAAALGFGHRVVAQGPLTMGYVQAMLAGYAGGAAGVRTARFRFAGAVFGGERVTAGGAVTAVDGDCLDCAVWLDVDREGGPVRAVTGTARVAPPDRPVRP